MTRHLENAGLLDFEPVRDTQIPGLCRRAACWPDGMPQSLEPASLGLDQATVEEEKVRRERERQRRVIERRSIDFAGTKLDTADPSFAEGASAIGGEQHIPMTTVGLSAAAGPGWLPSLKEQA